jgi:thiosulfate/3-mercaptopyruvate sulfurtransferase
MTSAPPISRRDQMLVSPQWLQAHLDDPDLRIIDCSAQLIIQPVGASRVESGLPQYRQAHIPGARYLNMATDLSDPTGAYPYTFPSDAQIAGVLGTLGISDSHRVVLYGSGYLGSITRVWYVLHTAGHRSVALLDGGFERWQREGRPVSAELPAIRAETYRVRRRPEHIADAQTVLATLDDPRSCRINALSREQFSATGGTHYGRPGSIAASTSAPAREMVDPATGSLLPDDVLRAQLAAAGAWAAERAVAYCGGGIAASTTAFVLEMLGHPGWTLYDNSLLEWATRPELPMQPGRLDDTTGATRS